MNTSRGSTPAAGYARPPSPELSSLQAFNAWGAVDTPGPEELRRSLRSPDGLYVSDDYRKPRARPSAAFAERVSPSAPPPTHPDLVAHCSCASTRDFVGSLRSPPRQRSVTPPAELRGVDVAALWEALSPTAQAHLRRRQPRSEAPAPPLQRTHRMGQGPYNAPLPRWTPLQAVLHRREWRNPFPEDSPAGRVAAHKRALALQERSARQLAERRAHVLLSVMTEVAQMEAAAAAASSRTPGSSGSRGYAPRTPASAPASARDHYRARVAEEQARLEARLAEQWERAVAERGGARGGGARGGAEEEVEGELNEEGEEEEVEEAAWQPPPGGREDFSFPAPAVAAAGAQQPRPRGDTVVDGGARTATLTVALEALRESARAMSISERDAAAAVKPRGGAFDDSLDDA